MRRFSGRPSDNKAEIAVALQGNIHRSRTAHDFLKQICFEKHADIILIGEQYRN